MADTNNQQRKLYRSKSDRFITGVCGGIADYFGIDSNLVRILFVIMSFMGGIGIILYITALIILPENPHEEYSPRKAVNRNLVLGLILVIVGGLFLFRELGLFHRFYLFDISFATIWGVLLIALGVLFLFQSRSQTTGAEQSEESGDAKNSRKLYRSRTDKMISGVCGGIGNYFNVDPSLIRIGYVIATFFSVGLGILVYILLAIILPEESAS